MKRFDFATILLGILILLTFSLTSCSIGEMVITASDCRNFQISEVGFHQVRVIILSDAPSVEVCKTATANGKQYTQCKTVLAHYYNCYSITGTEGVEHLTLSVDGCEKIAW